MREWMPSVSAVPFAAMSSRSASSSSARQRTTWSTGPNTSSCQFARGVELDDGRGDIGAAAPAAARRDPQRKRTRPARSMSAIQLSSFCLAVGVDHRADMGRRRRADRRLSVRARRRSACRASARRCLPAGKVAAAPSSAGRRSGTRTSITSSITCSGSAVASTIMALMPPVSAISGTIGPALAASARLIARPTSVEPVKTTPATRGSATRLAPTSPSPGTRCSAACRHAGFVQQRDRPRGDQRRLLGRLGDNGIAGGERRASTWPRKIASGKFHGLMQTKTPRPR